MMRVAIIKELKAGERRVALIPSGIGPLQKLGLQVQLESDAGSAAGFLDASYQEKGAEVVDRQTALSADIILAINGVVGDDAGQLPPNQLHDGQVLIASCDPLGQAPAVAAAAAAGVKLFGLEMIPRITRAQSMDVLSSMATVAGYRAVILAAAQLPQMFPLMMTAAGTLSPARVFVIGAGVAGLQAIATARRLGAVVQAYDVRPAVCEQCESLGAKFVELPLETDSAEGKGGYAKAMDEAFYQRQRQLMADVVAECDVVITTAAIPGRPSPLLVTADAVQRMQPGSVIVDLAAERGGNCELAEADQTVVKHGVTILGPTNLPAEVPHHASQMYSKNVQTFLKHLVSDGTLQLDMSDEITRDTLLTNNREVVSPRLRQILELPELPASPAEEPTPEAAPEPKQDS